MTEPFNRPGRAPGRLRQRCLRDEMISVLLGLIGAGVGVSYALTALLPIFAVAGVRAAKNSSNATVTRLNGWGDRCCNG